MLISSAAVARYGENFRRLRGRTPQEEIARRLKLKRQANVSAIELSDKIPSAKTILRHAAALRHLPSELLSDVETEYDRIRAGIYDNVVAQEARPKRAGEANVPTTKRRQVG